MLQHRAFCGLAIVGALLTGAQFCSADMIQADIFETEDLPFYDPSGPRTFQVDNAAIDAGPELTAADETSNPSGWDGYLQVDLTGSTVTVTHAEDFTDFQTASITIDDILFSLPGQFITGITLVNPSIIDGGDSDPFTESVSFTANSITLSWFVNDIAGGDLYNYISGGSATYEITFGAAAVPEPATMSLVGLGAIGLVAGAIRRRRTAK